MFEKQRDDIEKMITARLEWQNSHRMRFSFPDTEINILSDVCVLEGFSVQDTLDKDLRTLFRRFGSGDRGRNSDRSVSIGEYLSNELTDTDEGDSNGGVFLLHGYVH